MDFLDDRFRSANSFHIDHVVDFRKSSSYFVALRHRTTGRLYLFLISHKKNEVFFRNARTDRWDLIADKREYRTVMELLQCCLVGQETLMIIQH